MDYKGLIEDLRAAADLTGVCEIELRDAVTAIETLLVEREAAGWISVEDRTPKDDDDGLEFICMTSATGRCNGVISLNWEVTKIRGKIVRRWMWHGRICPWEVTYWKPLPTPPDRQQTESEEDRVVMDRCCATCEYWLKKYQKCEHPEQFAGEAEGYMSPPDKLCELYEAST